jgi:NTP pyrophosphatase (non-canonical NTP hydrolase)
VSRSFTEICQYALDKWGMNAQLDQMAEECAEFIIALNHFRRGRINEQQLLEEIADVSVMVQEMKVYFYEQVEVIEKRKIRRLNRKINSEIDKAGLKPC